MTAPVSTLAGRGLATSQECFPYQALHSHISHRSSQTEAVCAHTWVATIFLPPPGALCVSIRHEIQDRQFFCISLSPRSQCCNSGSELQQHNQCISCSVCNKQTNAKIIIWGSLPMSQDVCVTLVTPNWFGCFAIYIEPSMWALQDKHGARWYWSTSHDNGNFFLQSASQNVLN